LFKIPLAVVFLFLAGMPALADEFPRFDIDATCRAAPRLMPSETDVYQSCVQDETEARNQLERRWASFNDGQRQECVRVTNDGGSPSYVDVLACMEVAAGIPASMPRRSRQVR
jgi:hypothetical protein